MKLWPSVDLQGATLASHWTSTPSTTGRNLSLVLVLPLVLVLIVLPALVYSSGAFFPLTLVLSIVLCWFLL